MPNEGNKRKIKRGERNKGKRKKNEWKEREFGEILFILTYS